MSAYRYYEEENRQWKSCNASQCTAAEAKTAIAFLANRLSMPMPPVKFRMQRGSWARPIEGQRGISFGVKDGLSWLTVAHEFAHLITRGVRAHGPEHALNTRGTLQELVYGGFLPRSEWDKDVARQSREQERICARIERKASVDERAELIKHRQAQILRLERKIKALTTRRKTALRSLAQLERHATAKPA